MARNGHNLRNIRKSFLFRRLNRRVTRTNVESADNLVKRELNFDCGLLLCKEIQLRNVREMRKLFSNLEILKIK